MANESRKIDIIIKPNKNSKLPFYIQISLKDKMWVEALLVDPCGEERFYTKGLFGNIPATYSDIEIKRELMEKLHFVEIVENEDEARRIIKKECYVSCTECYGKILVIAKRCRHCGFGFGLMRMENEGSNVIYVKNEKNGGIAAILNLLIPGLGYLYLGKFLAAILAFFCVSIGYGLLIIPGIILHMTIVLDVLRRK